MKTRKHYLLFMLATISVAQLAPSAQAQYTFGPEVQSTPSTSIAYNSVSGKIEFTNTANPSEDYAYLPLTGEAAGLITTSNNWIASFVVDLSPTTMVVTNNSSAHVVMGLAFGPAIPANAVFLFAGQWNNTGGGDDAIYPHGWYGTATRFGALLNNAEEVVTTLGNSQPSSNGSVYLHLTGATNASPATESFGGVTGVVTLAYNASTKTVTAYFNETPVGSYSIAGWRSNSALTLAVWGGSGESVDVPSGTDTADGFYAGHLPILSFFLSGGYAFLTWPTAPAGFTLQFTTNLASSIWTPVPQAPVIIGTNNMVTTPISGAKTYYRLNM